MSDRYCKEVTHDGLRCGLVDDHEDEPHFWMIDPLPYPDAESIVQNRYYEDDPR